MAIRTKFLETNRAEKEFNVHKWVGDGIEHIESPFIDWRK
ncbi:hypothetical protein CHPC929_0047 [Streptococcus phage CHPC929]|nr:hypothetical protein CHPC929_0047 [Streptococcus phage CHPC929]